ncbi:MAG: hypothetical protein H7Y09_03935, partial [Chitinophagaceae bacterium]|nr:hypothetical protein [Anaerolineae bacterium]
DTPQILKPLDIPPTPTWTADKRLLLFNKMLADPVYGDMTLILKLLGAALDERGLLIYGFSPDSEARLDLVQGLMMLLPASARLELTFSTNVVKFPTSARMIFTETNMLTDRWIVDFNADVALPDALLDSPYMRSLVSLWQGDIKAFTAELRSMDLMAANLMPGKSLQEGLAQVSERYLLDVQVLSDYTVAIEQIKGVIKGESPPAGALLGRYAERLLYHALQERDTEAAEMVAQAMDEDAELDQLLNQVLTSTLETEPDSVYLFIRTHLGQKMNERWLPRLQTAAVISLRVAIDDGDSETLISWMKLIAREPSAYHLGEVLNEGLLAAQKRTYEDGDLGHQLLMLASKRLPASLEMLLDDSALVAALPYPLGPALREHNPEAFTTSVALGREIALALMYQAIRDHVTNVITSTNIDFIWTLSTDGLVNNVPDYLQPAHTLVQLATEGASWLTPEAFERLLTLTISGTRIDLFRLLVAQLAQNEALFPLLTAALQNSALPPDQILNLVGQVMGDETITPQQALNIYVRLIANRAWHKNMLPLIEQVARLIHQNQAPTMQPDILWRMLQAAAETKSETIARAATKRLIDLIEAFPDDTLLAENLVRLWEGAQWSVNSRAYLITHWREWVHTQPTLRLQSLEKMLDGKRVLEEVHAIVQTTLAVRKMLGKRSLEDFADAIGTTYAILQIISDSFDRDGRQAIAFDQPTVRAELDSRQSELTPDERKVLAKNLKELAQVVILMADNRSKAAFGRRGEDIERGLLKGEQQPQSAIDTIKWLSGYFDGMQQKTQDEDQL